MLINEDETSEGAEAALEVTGLDVVAVELPE